MIASASELKIVHDDLAIVLQSLENSSNRLIGSHSLLKKPAKQKGWAN